MTRLASVPMALGHSVVAAGKISGLTIASALTGRDWSLAASGRGQLAHAILVSAGRGHLVRRDDPLEFTAPALVWVPPRGADRLHLRAGGAGHLLAIADDLLTSTMGIHAESIALGQIAGRMTTVALSTAEALAELRHSFAAIEAELARAERGAWTSIAAHVALIMVALWRGCEDEAVVGHARGSASAILQRFRYLVELHFRDHWTIPQYAAVLAASADRLHAICVRELGRPPLKLVHERVVREAMLLLERSLLSVERISDHLGFKDPAHFNRFFKANVGVPPGAFRAEIVTSAARGGRLPPSSFADWP